MATIVLSAAGAAIGGSVGGTFAGLSSVAIGRAVGATIGKVIDQRLLGQGSDAVEHGRVDRFRLSNAGEGAAVGQVYGRMRVAGQVIWASDFSETTRETGGGKGAPSQPRTREYSYSVSLAIALCEGEITRVGRVWADGQEVAPGDLNMKVYNGRADQLPDPTIEAVEGTGEVPAYRGTAYVVMENLPLSSFGNRVPQFSFEVVRPERADAVSAPMDMARGIEAVALMPGTGEYALATTHVHYSNGDFGRWTANVHSPAARADFSVSLEALDQELPNCGAASLVVSWFGNDLRCGSCELRPKVERKDADGANMPWSVAGIGRAAADQIAQLDGRPIYGGTPADAAVLEAIAALKAAGKAVMFYPFILMDQLAGNALPDPYSDAETQPALPWRGRITLSEAPGRAGSPDGSAVARAEVNAFFGTATAADFSVGEEIAYTGPDEWSFSRFILHYAGICAKAGGVDSFCIGSELRGLTQIRDDLGFPAVERMRALAQEVRAILGPGVKIGYAADWSEYFGYQPQDGSGDRYFHLDPLWADPAIDFIGIDNYMPLSDWRDGEDHSDAGWESIYDLDYLRSNVAGGEGYDWYYASDTARNAQVRTPIADEAHGEPWIWRYKDLRNWWSNPHHERIGGVRQPQPTEWVPGSKPIWFTEMGCPAVDKGTNEPNKFYDPKSSESDLPHFSSGVRDDLIQRQYIAAMLGFWNDEVENPSAELYEGRMVDMTRAFVWAWDLRPYPFFPSNNALWSDGANFARGHWINGRASARTLASVVEEICERAGLTAVDTSALFGVVRGFTVDDVDNARAALQPLMLRYGFDAIERDGVLRFQMRTGTGATMVMPEAIATSREIDGIVEQTREAEAQMQGRVRLRFVEADGDFEAVAEEAVLPDEVTHSVASTELPIAMTRGEGRQVAERWLAEARMARDAVRVALPPSLIGIGAGDVIELAGDQGEGLGRYRVDRVEQGTLQTIEAVRIEPAVYAAAKLDDTFPRIRQFVPPVPLTSLFLDLPLMTGDEEPHAPHVAISGNPWPGSVAIYRAGGADDFVLSDVIPGRSTIGRTETVLPRAASGRYDRGDALQVRLADGVLSSVGESSLWNGANLMAIGDGTPDNWELFQFRDAELVDTNTYLLRNRLRGQLGTEAGAATDWPAGSWAVVLDGVTEQVSLPSSLRRIAQTYRVGPARRPLDDPSFAETTTAFDGIGLRPYAPVHLRSESIAGDHTFRWVRRTRLDGDNWDLPEVPVGEEREAYHVRVLQAGTLKREVEVGVPEWTYDVASRTADGVSAPFQIEVSQISGRFGPGVAAKLTVDA